MSKSMQHSAPNPDSPEMPMSPSTKDRNGAVNTSSKSLWPLGIIAAIFLFISINMVMVSIAYHNPSVPAAKDHWAESMAFDEEYDRRVASQKLGWRAEIRACEMNLSDSSMRSQKSNLRADKTDAPAAKQADDAKADKNTGRSCALRIQIFDRDNQEVSGLAGKVSIRRGDSAQFDRESTLRAERSGYIADLQLGRPGYYDLKLELQKGEHPWQSQRRLWLGPRLQ